MSLVGTRPPTVDEWEQLCQVILESFDFIDEHTKYHHLHQHLFQQQIHY